MSRRHARADAPATAAPVVLPGAGQRRVLATLCVTETVSWGVLFYAFPVLISGITADTGWSSASATAAFSAGLLTAAVVGIPVGRWLDAHGPRWVMTAGSVGAAPSVVIVASAPNLAVFAAGWVAAGVSMAAVLYPPAFTALTRWFGTRRVKALTVLTLAAGLASTVFAPLTAFLAERFGWRDTYVVLAAVLVAVTVPAHWWGLRGPWPAADQDATRPTGESPEGGPGDPARIARSLPFLAVLGAVALASFAAFAALVNLVPLLIERGMDTSTAALALGLGGIGQLAGRIGYPLLSTRLAVHSRTILILTTTALTTGTLGMLTSSAILMIAAVVAGMARGLLTLVHATAVSDRWGVEHYGRLTGMLSAPVTVTVALAPWAGAAIADSMGGYSDAFLVLAAVGLAGAGCALVAHPAAGRSR